MLKDYIEELLNQGHCWEFVRDKARKKGSTEPKDMDRLDRHTNDKDQRPTKVHS